MGLRFLVPSSNLGQIPFNCNFDHVLPDKIKIACKARFISCTLGFTSYALPFTPFLIGGLYRLVPIVLKVLFSKFIRLINIIYNNMQRDLFVF